MNTDETQRVQNIIIHGDDDMVSYRAKLDK